MLVGLAFPLALAMASRSFMRLVSDALEEALVSTFSVGHMDAGTPISTHTGQRPMHVIVTLGYRMLEDDSPSPLLAQRIALATNIAQATERPMWLAFSGGTPLRGRGDSEAVAMLRYAQRCCQMAPRQARSARGLWRTDEHGILLENRSRTTRENAVETVSLIVRELLGGGASSHPRRRNRVVVTVVSNRFHMPRACRTFSNAAAAAAQHGDLQIRCAAVPPSSVAVAPSDGEEGRGAGGGIRQSESHSAWCHARGNVPDPREVVLLALREVPALVLYAWRGWL